MIRPFGDKIPKIAESVFVSEAAYVIGDVEIGENSSVFPGAVVRADFGTIRIGKNTHIQDNVVVHVGPPSLEIGDNVLVGHGAVVHARKIGNNVLIGMNATIMDHVEIEDHCIIAGGAILVEGMKVPRDSFVAGVPAKQIGLACRGGTTLKFNNNHAICGYCGDRFLLQEGKLT